LDGLWIEYAWSVTNAALHIRINHVQIDNQLDYTIFPVILYPIISKATGTDLAEKPFIELSVYESKTTRSNVMQFKYFKLLIQEFAVKIDQGLIVSILAFLRAEKVSFSNQKFFVHIFSSLEFISANHRYEYRFRTNRKTIECNN
jgi:vacuolar protein sorting-associated protein 13A/C